MLTLKSPAKIHVFNHVAQLFPDGRPDTVALSVAVNLFDTWHLDIDYQDSLHCDIAVPDAYRHTLCQAVDLFRFKAGIRSCFKLTLQKKVPVWGGLSALSSNVATLFFGLNHLTNSGINLSDLKGWSQEIICGAQFFFSLGLEINRGGYVEELPQKDLLKELGVLCIATPKTSLPASAVFRRFREEDVDRRDIEQMIFSAMQGKPKFFNDLEESAFAIDPRLALLKQKLKQSNFQDVILTGSGPSLICIGKGDASKLSDEVFYFKAVPVTRSVNGWYGEDL